MVIQIPPSRLPHRGHQYSSRRAARSWISIGRGKCGRSAAAVTRQKPGIAPIVSYLEALPYRAEPNCATAHYYMLDNTNPGFLPNGFRAPSPATQKMLPPSSVRTIGDALNEKNITWAYFGGAYNDA